MQWVIFGVLFGVWILIGGIDFLVEVTNAYPDYTFLVKWFTFFIPGVIKRWFNYHRNIKHDRIPCFSAKQIITFEKTAPVKWNIVKNTSEIFKYWEIYYNVNKRYADTPIGVKTIFDYWKVISYFKNRDKNKEKISNTLEYDEKMATLLTYFQKDAENASKEAEKMMKEKEQEILNILNRLPKTSN